jgi:hypothetical protein
MDENAFQITKVHYFCGAPGCPEHEATPIEFFEHAMVMILLLGAKVSNIDELIIGMMAEGQAQAENYPEPPAFP